MNDEHDHPSLCRKLLFSLCACFPRTDDPEREPLFPPPSTILTQPSAQPQPNARSRPTLPNPLSFTSSRSRSRSNSQFPSVDSSPTRTAGPLSGGFDSEREGTVGSRKREEAGRKMDSISKAFAGRMQPLEPSLPSTPSTARGIRPFSSTLALSHPSALSLTHHQQHQPPSPLSPRPRPTHPTRSQDTSVPNRGCRYDPYPYGATLPHRPSAPNLGRSISEPSYLADLGSTVRVDFAETQIPKYGPLIVDRLSCAGYNLAPSPRGGRPLGKGRVRSATTVERLVSPWEASRGRDREPSLPTMVREPSYDEDGSSPSPTKTQHSGSSLGTRSKRAGGERSLSREDSLDLSLEGSRRASPLPDMSEYPEGEGYFGEEGEEGEGVVKRDLGLSVLCQKPQKKRPKSKGKKRVSS
ncbi:hypothetical protein IAR50_007016 [Cryptococcus sp. DSM 104548]